LDIEYKTKKLEDECNNFKKLVKKYGDKNAKLINRRLDDMRSVESMDEVRDLPGRHHPLTGDKKGQFSIDLEHPSRLLYKPSEPYERKEDGGFVYSSITIVEIQGVKDTHDGKNKK